MKKKKGGGGRKTCLFPELQSVYEEVIRHNFLCGDEDFTLHDGGVLCGWGILVHRCACV